MSFGPPPPPLWAERPRSRAAAVAAVVLRVLLAAVPLASLGILAWVPLLRLALVRQRAADWWAFSAVAAASTGAFVLAGYTQDENDWQTNTGVALLLLLGAGSAAWFLYADTRPRRSPAGGAWAHPGYAPYPPAGPYTPGGAYGGPYTPGAPYAPDAQYAPGAPYAPDAFRTPGTPRAADAGGAPGGPRTGQAPAPASPPPASPPPGSPLPGSPLADATPPPPAVPPQGGRIDRVRAELDELSAYLREQEGR
ncbi:hypothetical protein LO771_13315 [Streptacidiphilus sp. ASG 303]|uniref:hypothetical protein n=1 Tax=Streptacidiphilus sp. ASG 303 TaxID=2896847 RepID=UPI001E2B9560|nr:hypothetical protein [Streptacidiphilus sp. ASG 303]MCD0483353.1 hypothetical protein [Streptacidiphilus sp. ASG 303]